LLDKVIERAKKEGWGCIPSPKDERDFSLAKIMRPVAVPTSVRYDNLFKIRDQGKCGSCVGQAVASADSAGHQTELSSLYIYSRCKQEDGIPGQEGTQIRIANGIVLHEGSPPEELLPYSLLKDCLVFPTITDAMKEAAALYKIKAYARIYTLHELKQALAAGKIIVAGLLVTDAFTNWNGKGIIGAPEGYIRGAHAVVFCGYDDSRQAIRGVNSWGERWGDKGFFWLDYANIGWKCDLGIESIFEMWAYEFEQVLEPKGSLKIELWIGNKIALVNGQAIELDVPPEIKDSRTLVPLRFVAENMGCSVQWFPKEKKIEIEGSTTHD